MKVQLHVKDQFYEKSEIYLNLLQDTVAELLCKFKHLKKLVISIEINIDFLLDMLLFLVNTENLKISASFEVLSVNDLDEKETKDIFKEAFEIVNEKFPHPCSRILDLKISEAYSYRHENRPEFSINYGLSGAQLTMFEVEDNSDSMCKVYQDYMYGLQIPFPTNDEN